MGCDIHLHVEFKVAGLWYHYSHPRVERDYRLFGKMAGVRDVYDEDTMVQPRGLPGNATFTTRLDSEVHWASGEWLKPYLPLHDIFGFV